jgi:hypothetical protein
MVRTRPFERALTDAELYAFFRRWACVTFDAVRLMNTKSLLLLTCLAPFALAPAVAATNAKSVSAKTAHAKLVNTSAARHKVRHSKERIYTFKPRPSKADAPADQPNDAIYAAGTRQPPFLGFAPTGNSQVGLGLWRMNKPEEVDPNRTNPLRDPTQETTRAAAVGVKLTF